MLHLETSRQGQSDRAAPAFPRGRDTARRVGQAAPVGLDRGTVVVEAALVIPVLLAVTVLLVWVVSLGATYVRLLDIAQTAARQAARGVTDTTAPRGVDVAITDRGGLLRVEASERVAPPLLGFADWGMTVRAEAHAAPESGWLGDSAEAW